MTAAGRPHIDIQVVGAMSPLSIERDEITLSIALEMRNDGSAAAQGVALSLSLAPLVAPVRVGEGMRYPPGLRAMLSDLCDRSADSRPALLAMTGDAFDPREARRTILDCALPLNLLARPGALFEDRTFLPILFVCASYLSATDRTFCQTGRAFQIRVRDPSNADLLHNPVFENLPLVPEHLVISWHESTGTFERG